MLGLGTTGLGAVRGLGEQGVPVVGVDWESDAPGLVSRYCERTLVIPHPSREPRRALEALLESGQRLETPAVLLPTTDVFLEFLGRHEGALRERFLFSLTDTPLREALTNKRLQAALVEAAGTLCPPSYPLRDRDDLRRISSEVRFPALLKPVEIHLWYPIYRTKAIEVNSPHELERRYQEIERYGLEVMVQSRIVGPVTNEYAWYAYVDSDGRVLTSATRRRLRMYPIDFGTSTFAEGVLCPEVERLGQDLFRRLGYRGAGGVQFKRDDRDGKLYFLELNGRLMSPNIHLTRGGSNLPLTAYLDLTGQPPKPTTQTRFGLRYLELTPDLMAFLELRRRGELSLARWLRDVASARVYSHFEPRDPLPFLAARRNDLRRAIEMARTRRAARRLVEEGRRLKQIDPAPERGSVRSR